MSPDRDRGAIRASVNKGGTRMFTRRSRIRLGYAGAVGLLLAALALSACSTLSAALDKMNKEIGSGNSSSMGTSGAFMTPQLNFYLFYSMVAVFSASASHGAAYKPGQGTVWTITDTNNGSIETTTLEQALLKKNGDGTAWWRLDVTSKDSSLLYEYLLGPDHAIDKVRYKDPNTGKIEEFIPDKSKEQQARRQQPQPAGQEATSTGTTGKGDKVTVTKDHQTVTVKAGSFSTEHVVYTNATKHLREESWTSTKVPGALVKFVNTNTESNSVLSTGELTKIESGMTTVLGSY